MLAVRALDVSAVLVLAVEMNVGGRVLLFGEWIIGARDAHVRRAIVAVHAEDFDGAVAGNECDAGQHK